MNSRLLAMLGVLCMGSGYLPAPAFADEPEEKQEVENEAPFETSLFSVDIEAFAARALDTNNRKLFNFGGGGSLYVNVNPTHWVSLQVGFTGLILASRDSDERTNLYGLSTGPRFHLGKFLGTDDDVFVDGHYNFSRSGPVARSGFDVGAGYRFALNDKRNVFLGPYARYYWGSDPGDDNPSVLMAGVSLTFGKRGRSVNEPCSDLDGDGWCDEDDHCPSEAAGEFPNPHLPGCPLRDRDGDGIFDVDDACPDVFGEPSPDPEKHGCPLPTPPPPLTTPSVLMSPEPVFFAFDSDKPLASEQDKLIRAADFYFQGVKEDFSCGVLVSGHTDSRGSRKYNQGLSERRASNVKAELVKLGVPSRNIDTQALGEDYPDESNETIEGRRKNRRVEFVAVICE